MKKLVIVYGAPLTQVQGVNYVNDSFIRGKQYFRENGIEFEAIHIKSKDEAQKAPTPITTYALFCDGEYITNEQMNDKRFLKLISRYI